jgi:hypothetical protein
VLPYASYLRVYESLDVLAAADHAWSRWLAEHTGKGLASDGVATLRAEQQSTLSRVVSPVAAPSEVDQLAKAYLLHRDGQVLVCPMDMPLRSWLSLTSLVDSMGDATVNALLPPGALAEADEAFLRWRSENPAAVPHIRQTTWGIPRTWFLTVTPSEREQYSTGDDGRGSVRYRTRLASARRRLARAHATLRRVLDDEALLEEAADLGRWLDSFHESGWLELDYAGVARLLGAAIHDDESAKDINSALNALRKGDLAAAGASYGAFEVRWRGVNAFERAN